LIAATLLLAACLPQTEADSYALDYLTPPEGEAVEVGGMDFLPDGSLIVSTRRGQVWWIENPTAADPADARFHLFCEGLQEGLGLRVVDGEIYVLQRSELSKLVDLDGDKVCDRIETLSQGWGMSGNYHEFAFGLPRDAAGNFYLSCNVGFSSPDWWLGTSNQPYRGWIVRVDPNGALTPWACGVRSPAGLGQDSKGHLFYTDNQGDWMPACGLFLVKQGDFFGHPASLRWREPYLSQGIQPSVIEPPSDERTPPVLWIPYEWSRSTGSMVEDTTRGRFGPFGGQLFLAELTNGMVVRAMLEEVDGQLQGACVPFRHGVGSAFRVAFASDGTLFTGFTNRGWGGLAPGSGIGRIHYTGKAPREVLTASLERSGFRVRFTEPLEVAAADLEISAHDYDYNYWWDYGSPMMRQRELKISGASLSADRKELRLGIDGLEAGRNVRVRIGGAGLLHDEFDYTLHRMPGGGVTVPVAKLVDPPEVKANPDEGWLTLTWLDPFDAWHGDGWELVNAELDPKDPTRFLITPGNGALVNTGFPAPDFVSKPEFGDIEFRFSFLMPKDGDSGLYLMGRYELQLNDRADQCLGVIDSKGPRAKGYRGPGEWHVVTGKFYAPRFDENGKKTANARFESIQADGVMVIGSAECEGPTGGAMASDEVPMGPLMFQGSAGRVAIGDVRVRVLQDGEAQALGAGWTPLEGNEEAQRDFELRGTLELSDQGTAAIWLRETAPGQGLRLVLDHNSSAKAHTGSLVGFEPAPGSSDGMLRTQLLQPGVPFDVRVSCLDEGEHTRVRVWLNDVLMNDITTAHVLPPGKILLEAERVPGTQLKVDSLLLRRLDS